MRANEILKNGRGKESEEIMKMIKEHKTSIHNMKFGSAGSKEKNVKLERSTKKNLARLMTLLGESKAAAKKTTK